MKRPISGNPASTLGRYGRSRSNKAGFFSRPLNDLVELLFGVRLLDLGRIELDIAAAALRLDLAKRPCRPHGAVELYQRHFLFLHIFAEFYRPLRKPPLEFPGVRHQSNEIHGNHEGTDEDRDDGVQLSARPFHEAPKILFPDSYNPFPSEVEGFKLALSDPVVDAPPLDPERLADLFVYIRFIDPTFSVSYRLSFNRESALTISSLCACVKSFVINLF